MKRVISYAVHSDNPLLQRVWCTNWNFDGSLLATCGDDKTVKVWRYVDDQLRKLSTLSGDHLRTIRYVEFSRDGKRLACASFDSTITIYRLVDGDFEELHKLEGHENEIKCCTFSPSDEYLASCSRDKTVWVWQVDDEECEVVSILQNHSADVKFVLWHPNEECLVSGGYDCSIRFYHFDGDDWVSEQTIADAHDDTVWGCAFDSDGDHMASCGADCFIRVWKRDATRPESRRWQKVVDHRVQETRWPLYTLAWNPSNNLIAVGGGDCCVRIYAFDAENVALRLTTNITLPAEVNCVRWNPRHVGLLAAACDDGQTHMVEVSGIEC